MKDSRPVRVGIVGAGRMGVTHYPLVNSHPAASVVAVAERSPVMLAMIERYLPVEAYRDYRALLGRARPDALVVCTPPDTHEAVIRAAAEAGVHVFAEKPCTTSARAAGELAELFAARGLVNQVGYVNRFNEVFVKLRELLADRVIGQVARFRSEMFSNTVTAGRGGGGWRAARASGGGVLLEMASHAIDLVNFLFGRPDAITGAALDRIHSRQVEDAASATFRYNAGTTGTLYVNWCDASCRKPANLVEVLGEHGRIVADQYSLRLFLDRPDDRHRLAAGWNTRHITDLFTPVPFYLRGNEFTRQVHHFIACVRGETGDRRCTFADGAAVLAVIEGIREDYEQHGRGGHGHD